MLYPTLTDESYITEVHHVNGKGKDGGVVYQEMEARENTCDDLVDRALKGALYPDSAYASETGGYVIVRFLMVSRVVILCVCVCVFWIS